MRCVGLPFIVFIPVIGQMAQLISCAGVSVRSGGGQPQFE